MWFLLICALSLACLTFLTTPKFFQSVFFDCCVTDTDLRSRLELASFLCPQVSVISHSHTIYRFAFLLLNDIKTKSWVEKNSEALFLGVYLFAIFLDSQGMRNQESIFWCADKTRLIGQLERMGFMYTYIANFSFEMRNHIQWTLPSEYFSGMGDGG